MLRASSAPSPARPDHVQPTPRNLPLAESPAATTTKAEWPACRADDVLGILATCVAETVLPYDACYIVAFNAADLDAEVLHAWSRRPADAPAGAAPPLSRSIMVATEQDVPPPSETPFIVRMLKVHAPASPAPHTSSDPAGHICQVVLWRSGKVSWHLLILRAADDGPFTGCEVARVASMTPALVAAARTRRSMETLRRARSTLKNVVDRLAIGIVLFGPDRRVQEMNAHAVALRQAGVVQVIDGRLVDPAAEDDTVDQALRRLSESGGKDGVSVVLARPEGEEKAAEGRGRVHLHAFALDAGDGSATAAGYVGFIASPEAPDTSIDAFRSLYGLTRVESEIVARIIGGETPGEISEAMRISIHTVRGYLKTIFRKTASRRQADLVRLASCLPRLSAGR